MDCLCSALCMPADLLAVRPADAPGDLTRRGTKANIKTRQPAASTTRQASLLESLRLDPANLHQLAKQRARGSHHREGDRNFGSLRPLRWRALSLAINFVRLRHSPQPFWRQNPWMTILDLFDTPPRSLSPARRKRIGPTPDVY
jgi:hypothetical protein